jgi:acetyl esterase/lipase
LKEVEMRNRSLLITTTSLALLLAACGASTVEAADEVAAPETVAPTTVAPPPEPAVDEAYELLTDEVVYHEDDDGTWTMNIFYPDSDGPWPLVVVYHGMTTAPALSEARAIAKRGAVVVAPQWLKETAGQVTREEYIDGALFDRAACAVGAAQQIAADYGADPGRTTVSGFSAGMHPTHWVGLGIVRSELCEVPLVHQPTGVVMGDSQFLFYEDGWDELIAEPEASSAADTLDRFINPERWDVPDDLAVYLWTSDHRYGRHIENPPGTDSWIQIRDATGTLLDDLGALDAFDDEFIDWMDNGLLMEMRMKKAGIDVVHEAVGGGHQYSDTVFDAIEVLITH